MTDEQINTRIAEIRGWDMDPEEAREWESRGQWTKHPEKTSNKLVSKRMHVPKYTEDLNAMRDAESAEMAKGNNAANYFAELQNIVQRDDDATSANTESYYPKLSRFSLYASARQRAEAFLRTLDKWEVQT